MENPVPSSGAFPTSDELDRLPEEACRSALAAIVGRAPGVLTRLAAERPFGSDEGLMAAAYRIVRELPETDLVELVSARPRDGSSTRAADGDETADDDGDAGDAAWIGEELAGLEEVYQARFGFPFTVFDAGRPRAQLLPLIEAALRNDRQAELWRAAADCVALAEDRLRRSRGAPLGRIEDE
ncbi:MAG TPA: 2-oxo-4-hydroxy-4-carboxy-5-ureidoimidazoline decarboxylase [Candidatus Limnocylindria bacterium]|nr:2-oxo-4-hydroxy-4-carboxy-5-ureidoimidazoline decarboxylase [Candidatus Limnocylindria bacterium]